MSEWMSPTGEQGGGIKEDYRTAIRFFLRLGSAGYLLLTLLAAISVAAIVSGCMAASEPVTWRHYTGLFTAALGAGTIALCLPIARAFQLTWEVERLIAQDQIRIIYDSGPWRLAVGTLFHTRQARLPLWMEASIGHAASEYAGDFYLSAESLQRRLEAVARQALAE
ncbi:hypothetical protein GTO91_01645 [Heliobacterium undosum]|uniref:Uncharacterized protein n=1 Tax=Heliomicrobium undosum TaxID=121734 RepID=A0A845KZ71_9FIRM|nr:hypothetical protein [Heliomicrobium undosum]MZP28426.1 hypothetical protein [Heliomicrobium undosum]